MLIERILVDQNYLKSGEVKENLVHRMRGLTFTANLKTLTFSYGLLNNITRNMIAHNVYLQSSHGFFLVIDCFKTKITLIFLVRNFKLLF